MSAGDRKRKALERKLLKFAAEMGISPEEALRLLEKEVDRDFARLAERNQA